MWSCGFYSVQLVVHSNTHTHTLFIQLYWRHRQMSGAVFLFASWSFCGASLMFLFGTQFRHLQTQEWGVNVQPYSGSPANFAVPRRFKTERRLRNRTKRNLRLVRPTPCSVRIRHQFLGFLFSWCDDRTLAGVYGLVASA